MIVLLRYQNLFTRVFLSHFFDSLLRSKSVLEQQIMISHRRSMSDEVETPMRKW